MNTNVLLPLKWHDYYYKLDNNLLTDDHIKSALTSLFKILTDINDRESLILIQFKIKIDNQFRSISYLQTVKLSEFKDLLEIFIEFWHLRDQDYISLNSSHIVFTYKILNTDNDIIKISKLKRHKSITNNINTLKFKGYNLPNTMDFSKWGTILNQTDSFALVKKANSNSIYHITICDDHLYSILKINDKIILEFKDTLIEKGKLESFTRKIKNQEYIFIDGELIIKKIVKETKFLTKILPAGFISDQFVTMDLETRTIDGRMIPYCVSIYDGNKAISFYLSDYKNSDELLKSSVRYLMKPKFHNHKIYLHNFSFFDGIFLIKILSQLTKIIMRPTIRDGRIIDLKFSFEILNNKINLYFRDSYLLLPSSLSKLATNFQVESKGLFPYSFVNNKDIPLDYTGEIPGYKYFDKLSIEDYIIYCNSFENKSWSLRDETIKYCEQDCRTLHQIIFKFQQKIFILFRIDILKYPTREGGVIIKKYLIF